MIRESIISKAKDNADLFRPMFLSWLGQNTGIFLAFEQKALYRWRSGREHYSARRIFEELRNDSGMSEEGAYKLNGNYCPDAARLFMLLHPECGEFFELRGRGMEMDYRQGDLFGVMA